MEDRNMDHNFLERILAGSEHPTNLPLAILKSITENFSKERKFSAGGFGEVYKGILPNGGSVAIKRIYINTNTVDDKLLHGEVQSLLMTKHPNIVRFLGFCFNTENVIERRGSEEILLPQIRERLLCFEYISNGSLDKHITDELRGLEWNIRYQIIKGICHGLQYLHNKKCIKHMDLKPQNIMVDGHMVPKIIDFGLSRRDEKSRTTGDRFISLGYCAPEYNSNGKISCKCDTYSLGVIIRELATGCRICDGQAKKSITKVLRRWKCRWNESVMYMSLQALQITKCIEMSERCTKYDPESRYSIDDVIHSLNEIENTNGHISVVDQTRLSSDDDMLRIKPVEQRLAFELNKEISWQIELTNVTGNLIAFNIKTLSQLPYCTEPKKGIVLPRSKRNVKITLQAQGSWTPQDEMHRPVDEFKVWSMKVEEGLNDEDITEDTINKSVADEVILTVVYDGTEKLQAETNYEPVSKHINSNNDEDEDVPGPHIKRLKLHHPPGIISDTSVSYYTRKENARAVDHVVGAMGVLLPKLELLKKEQNLHTNAKIGVEHLVTQLKGMYFALCSLSEAQQDQLDQQDKLWANEARELSYDIEDFLDNLQGSEPVTNQDGFRGLIQKVFNLIGLGKGRHHIIADAINEIKVRVKEVADMRVNKVGNFVTDSSAAKTIDPRIFNLYKDHKELVGIDGTRDELAKKLTAGRDGDVSRQQLNIISIFGHGGLGKTTLAKAVYDKVKGKFNLKALVPVGRNPNIKVVLGDILYELDNKKYKDIHTAGLDEKKLIDKLHDLLKNQRWFIIADDVWDKESWNVIRCALKDSNCGSRVVVTTRKSDVATHAGEAYEIQPLSRENSEKLLSARIVDAERREHSDRPSAEACDQILKKCGGVPLAIITIASLLATKPREEWSKVYNSIGFGHGDNTDVVNNTRRILSLSYYDLASYLKPCFLYLSVFFEDKFISKNTLITMWIAEGFIHEDQEGWVGLFERGERYFNELINRSMILPETIMDGSYVHGCRIHDMVLDLVRSLSSEENFVTVLDGDERQKLSGGIARRLALQRIEGHKGEHLANVAVDKVRSLNANRCNLSSLCPHIPVLHVLVVDDCVVGEEGSGGILDHLGSLIHLRYLEIRSTHVIKLPREVRYLKFLQTLDLRNSSIQELPDDVGLLANLVCLRLDWRIRVPAGVIGKLTSLQELFIQPGDDADVTMQFLKELGMLRELRELRASVDVTSEDMGRALLKSLGKLHNIRYLYIETLSGYMMEDHGHEGLASCRYLQNLSFNAFEFSQLPAWIAPNNLSNLMFLTVQVQVVKEQDMETLARLPELHYLDLVSYDTELLIIEIISPEGAGYFHKLRILDIRGPSVFFHLGSCESNSSSSSVASAIMPSLESLKFDVHVLPIKYETTLLSPDSLFGFESLGRTSLQTITVQVNCEYASILDVEDVKAALERTAAIHPKRPTLQITWEDMSPYQEACMDVSRIPELVIQAWEIANMVNSGHIQALRILDPEASSSKAVHLIYANSGQGLFVLSPNAVHKLWKWRRSDRNPRGKCTTSDPPQLWQPENGILMTNDPTHGNLEEAATCSALSKNDRCLISVSGGKVLLFDTVTFKIMTIFKAPRPTATSIAINPKDNSIIAIGMEDSSIRVYNPQIPEVKRVFLGHQKKITGLTFSKSMDVLVSSDADAQLCVWSIDNWEMETSRYIQPPSNATAGALVGDTMVQFHPTDDIHLLVTHESHLAIYHGCSLECLHLWSPRDPLPSPVSSAVYSSHGILVYAGFCDGAIGIFDAVLLSLHCRIAPSAYIPSSPSDDENVVYPMVVAAHPHKPNQIAVGMSDGAVHVLEPLEEDDNYRS